MPASHDGRNNNERHEAIDHAHMPQLAGILRLTGLGSRCAGVKLLVGPDLLPEQHGKVPVPGFDRANNKQFAIVGLEHVPQPAASLVEDVHGAKERDHENGINGVVPVENLAKNNLAISRSGEPGTNTR